MTDRIAATFEVVTPLFLGGADPAETVELRAPSIKGALRFWWRALAWSEFGGDLHAIHAKEAKLFGTAGKDNTDRDPVGQASFGLRTRLERTPTVINAQQMLTDEREQPVGPGARYLGYGLMEAFGRNAGRLTRPCLKAPIPFSIELTSRSPLDRSLVNAVKLMGLVGGLGSRSRRGYGSISIASLTGDTKEWRAPKTPAEYSDQLRAIVLSNVLSSSEPLYSAFSSLSRIVTCDSGGSPLILLDNVGRQMQRYRSWGHNGNVNGEASERNFQQDHDWFRNRTNFDLSHPKRVIFGLPHNYSKATGVTAQDHDRRGSPLFIHLHKLSVGQYIAVLLVLRSNFLPTGEKLLVQDGRSRSPREPTIDWTVLDQFIDGVSKNTGQPYFSTRIPIFP